jgi:hypothetical protein
MSHTKNTSKKGKAKGSRKLTDEQMIKIVTGKAPKLPQYKGPLTDTDRLTARQLVAIARDPSAERLRAAVAEHLCNFQSAAQEYDTGPGVIEHAYLALAERAREIIAGERVTESETGTRATILFTHFAQIEAVAALAENVPTPAEHAAAKLLAIINDPSMPEVVRGTLVRAFAGLAAVVANALLNRERGTDDWRGVDDKTVLDAGELATWIDYAEREGIRPRMGSAGVFK